MSEDAAPLGSIALVAAALLAAPLAGCLEAKGPFGEDPQATKQEAVREASVTITLDPRGEGDLGTVELYVDEEDKVAVQSFENLSMGDRVSRLASQDHVVYGVVHQDRLGGSPPIMVGSHHPSSTWEDNVEALPGVGEGDSQALWGAFLEPGHARDALEQASAEASITWSRTEYRGDEVRQVHLEHENETHRFDVHTLVDPDTGLVLHAEGTVWQEDLVEEPVDVASTITYGDEASHAYEEAIRRLASMTLYDADQPPASEPTRWTVQPSADPGLVALDEAEIQLLEDRSLGPDTAPALTVPAERGQVNTEEGLVGYDDIDDDGRISPGDEITFEPNSDAVTNWRLALNDEATGLRLVT